MTGPRELTEENVWDEVWESHRLPQNIKEPNHLCYVDILDEFFHKYLPRNERFEFLELGCAPGRWLHYFNSEFGYKVSGLDNSPVGFKMTKKNLEILGTKANLYCGNALHHKFDMKFDVVFSAGLIEHFEPPTQIIEKHLDLVKNGGYVVIGIPNLKRSLYYHIQKRVNKQALTTFLLLHKKDLAAFFDDSDVIACQYLGVFNLYLLNLHESQKVYRMINRVQTYAEKIMRIAKIKGESWFFSPYIFIVVKKKNGECHFNL